jgi:hypothetical protein
MEGAGACAHCGDAFVKRFLGYNRKSILTIVPNLNQTIKAAITSLLPSRNYSAKSFICYSCSSTLNQLFKHKISYKNLKHKFIAIVADTKRKSSDSDSQGQPPAKRQHRNPPSENVKVKVSCLIDYVSILIMN